MIELGNSSNGNSNGKNHDADDGYSNDATPSHEQGSPDGCDHTCLHGDVHDSSDDDQVVEIILQFYRFDDDDKGLKQKMMIKG